MARSVAVIAFLLAAVGGSLCCTPDEIDDCATRVYHVFYHPEDYPTTTDQLKTRCDAGISAMECLEGIAKRCPEQEKGITFFIQKTREAAGGYCANVSDPKNAPFLAFGSCIKLDKTKKYTCGDDLISKAQAAKSLDTVDKQKQGVCCAFRKLKKCIKENVVDTCTDAAVVEGAHKFYEAFLSPIAEKCKPFTLTDDTCKALFEGVTIEPPKTKSAMSSIIAIFSQS